MADEVEREGDKLTFTWGTSYMNKDTKTATIVKEKAEKFIRTYGGILFESYDALISAPAVEAVYLPLPPALHYEYAQKVLINGKHLLVEKPATLSGMESHSLISSAREKGLALHENYMFVYHRQIEEIRKLIARGDIGDIRLLSMKFGFPKRAEIS